MEQSNEKTIEEEFYVHPELEDTLFFKIIDKIGIRLEDMYEYGQAINVLQKTNKTEIYIGLKECINNLFDIFYRATCFEPVYGDSVSIDEFVQYTLKSDLSIARSKSILSVTKYDSKAIEFKNKYDVYQKKLDKFASPINTTEGISKIPIFKSKYDEAMEIQLEIDCCIEKKKVLNQRLKENLNEKSQIELDLEKVEKQFEKLSRELDELLKKRYKIMDNEGTIPKEGMDDLIFIFDDLGTDIANFFTNRFDLLSKDKIKRIIEKTTKFFIEKKGNTEFQSYAKVYDMLGIHLPYKSGLKVSEELYYNLQEYENDLEEFFNDWATNLITNYNCRVDISDEENAEEIRKEKWKILNNERCIYEKYMKINKEKYRVEII